MRAQGFCWEKWKKGIEVSLFCFTELFGGKETKKLLKAWSG